MTEVVADHHCRSRCGFANKSAAVGVAVYVSDISSQTYVHNNPADLFILFVVDRRQQTTRWLVAKQPLLLLTTEFVIKDLHHQNGLERAHIPVSDHHESTFFSFLMPRRV